MVQLKNIFHRARSPVKENLDYGVGLVLAPGPDSGLYVKFIVENVSVSTPAGSLGGVYSADSPLLDAHGSRPRYRLIR